MAKKYQDKCDVEKELNLTTKQLDKAERRMLEKHPLEDWIYVRNASNGETTIYYDRQFIKWIKEVYLIRNKYYLDLEIDFYERLIKEIVSEKNIDYHPIEYKDMDAKEMMDYFEKDYKNIKVAIHKMHNTFNSNLKYYKDGSLIIKAEGIKWINEKYYRISYLKYLEKLKLSLEGNKIG